MDSPSKLSLKSGSIRRVVFVLIASIVLPLVAGILNDPNGNPVFSVVDQVWLGLATFIVSSLVTISFDLSNLLALQHQSRELKFMEDEVDLHLNNIRTSAFDLARVRPSQQNLYHKYFLKVLAIVERDITKAAKEGELKATETLIGTTNLLLDVIENRGHDQLKLVHRLDSKPNDFDYSAWARMYYERLSKIIAVSEVKLQRLFVFSCEAELLDDQVQKLFVFHNNIGAEFRAIDSAKWNQILAGTGVSHGYHEFGLWGDLAFLSEKTEREEISGRYITNRPEMSRLIEAFQTAWHQGKLPEIVLPNKSITLDELFSKKG